ncbi:KAP family P-loop NTPase fold protein [Porphyromonas cangingivalis]|uniref:KAP family P-loop NTPase fold protein n=1 Tax=Porphyromonas cangingivalis TaxID=36874 RepID=UPI00051D777C|nr:P-loop NTPase fold protein [Porphyromonas cangingivalis]KGL48074.1 hypothetical protein HQ34_07525 [Porphyromonas cangingivalis]
MSEKNNIKSETNSKFREGLNELLKQTKSFIFEEAQGIILFLIALLLLFLFEDETKALFYDKVLPVMNRMNFGIVSWSILSLLSIFHLHYVWQCVKNNYRISVFSFLLITLVIILLFNGLLLDYSSIEIQILIFFVLVAILCFWIFSFINFFPCQSGTETQAEEEKLLSIDTPIKNKDDDRLGFSEDINLLISKLPKETEQAYSVGIVGSWGSGKTSYLNFLEKKLNKEQFIVIKFNPRHSLNACTIQEDFFHELYSTLKRYDSRFSSSFKDYLKAINIIGENKFLSSFLSIHQLWNSGREKQKISEAIKRLGKRVVVFIDDFDRLLREEVIEVLKLIDGNASFSNMIFFAAYDKQHLNKILVSENTSETKLFSDKYFSIEQSTPLATNEVLWQEIVKSCKKFKAHDTAFTGLHNKESRLYFSINRILPTLRDVKRLSNLFLRYEIIKNEINFRDYFLLMLIKYRWNKEYLELKNKKYLRDSNDYWSIDEEKLPKDSEESDLLKRVLSLLFDQDPLYNGKDVWLYNIKAIRSMRAFEIYFQERVSEDLCFEELTSIFEDPPKEIKEKISLWIKEGYARDVFNILEYNKQEFKSKDFFSKFLTVGIYANKTYDNNKKGNLDKTYEYEKATPEKDHEFELNETDFSWISKYYTHKMEHSNVSSIFKSNDEYRECIKEVLKSLDIYFQYKCAIDISENESDDTEPWSSDVLFDNVGTSEILKGVFLRLIQEDMQIRGPHMDLLKAYTKKKTVGSPLDSEIIDSLVNSLEKHSSDFFFQNFYSSKQETSTTMIFIIDLFYCKIFSSSAKSDPDLFLINSTKVPTPVKLLWKLYKHNDKICMFNFGIDENTKSPTEILQRECRNLDKTLEMEDEFDNLIKNGEMTLGKAENLLETIRKFPVRVSKYQDVVNKINQKIDELSKS